MSLYRFEFLESAAKEFHRLPRVDQLLFQEKLIYLLRNPFQAHPWLRIRQGARRPGEWRSHLGEWRVFYRVDGLTIIFTRIVQRPRAYPRRPPKAPRR